MSVTGYQCQRCWATFMEERSCGDVNEAVPKCPYCESADVKKVEMPESWTTRARGGLRFG
jgi:hypothetical protein